MRITKNTTILYLFLALAPYLILTLCIGLTNFIRFKSQVDVFLLNNSYLSFSFVCLTYVIAGSIFSLLAYVFFKIKQEKLTVIILSINLFLLIFSLILPLFGLYFFINFGNYFLWTFLLIGFHGSLILIRFISKKKNISP
ncbi:MAG: hypothetical protein RSA71_06675 [Eubacterium sp.]